MTYSTTQALKKEELWNVSLLPVEPHSRIVDELASDFDERSGVHRRVSVVDGDDAGARRAG